MESSPVHRPLLVPALLIIASAVAVGIALLNQHVDAQCVRTYQGATRWCDSWFVSSGWPYLLSAGSVGHVVGLAWLRIAWRRGEESRLRPY